MAGATIRTHEGPWRRLINSSAASTGSIHDDAVARRLGYEGGFVPGSVVGAAALPALSACFGPRWLEGGWYTLKFIAPVYVHEDVREVAEPSGPDAVTLRVENREGRLCCAGSAGLGVTPPWTAEPANPNPDLSLVPELRIGRTYSEQFSATAAEAARLLDAAGDDTPWGRPVLPPELIMNLALQQTGIARQKVLGVRQPGIWAEHALVLRRPLLLDTPYRLVQQIVDKGRSGRTVYLTYSLDLTDTDGAQVAFGRHKVKWFAEE